MWLLTNDGLESIGSHRYNLHDMARLVVFCLCCIEVGALSMPGVSNRLWDFLPLYAAGGVVGSSAIYSPTVIQQEEIRLAGVTGPSLLFTRPPFYAWPFWLIHRIPWTTACLVWTLLRTLAVAGFVWFWPWAPRSTTALVTVLFLPLGAALLNGQDSPFLILCIAIAERCWRRRPFLAGAFLSLCSVKYHLFLFLPVFVLLRRRSVVPGFLCASGALVGLSFLADPTWLRDYPTVLRLQQIHPSLWLMPNLHRLQLPASVEAAVASVLAATICLAIWKLSDNGALVAALAAGVFLSYHCYLADLTILLPGVAMLGNGVLRACRGRMAT